MRFKALLLVSLLPAACAQMLGIDEQYSRDLEHTPSAGGAAQTDASVTPTSEPLGAGGAPGGTSQRGAAGDVAAPPQSEMGGAGTLPPPYQGEMPSCSAGHKLCDGKCTAISPDTGCADVSSCHPCIAHANARTTCGAAGECESICNPGYVPQGRDCVPQPAGAGGATGAGGSPPRDSGAGGGGNGDPSCDPLQCPACNRGFEGCCIPKLPDGTPSHCGCFYFPPLCTSRVG